MPPPFASVVITTFNHERYIAEAIESTLAQTFGDREIIVIDDGSTDSTASIVKRYADRIVSIRQANSGVAGSRNRGVREAKGQLILLMDGDDTWHPDHVARHVDAFRRFPEAGLIVNDSRYMDGTLVLGPSTLPKTLPGIIATDGNVALCQCGDALVQNNFIWTTSEVSLPRAVVDEIGRASCRERVLYTV